MSAIRQDITTYVSWCTFSYFENHFIHIYLEIPEHFLHTPTSYPICSFSGGGEFCYFGIASGIQRLADKGCLSTMGANEHIFLQINVDGLPIFKSSNLQLWSILCLIIKPSVNHRPFLVAAFCGEKKPLDLNEYLSEFVAEGKHLEENGISINVLNHGVSFHSFVCDAPAQAFLKNTKLHSGYSSCERCTQEGEWSGRVIFPEINHPLWTNIQFLNMTDDGHHHGPTPLNSLSVNFIADFVLDYMHLLCLGVIRRLLKSWINGPLNIRLQARVIQEISKLVSLSAYIPREFIRKPRGLSDIDRWKATKFRLFLLYTGIVAQKGKINADLYNNFLLLFVSSCILLSPSLANHDMYEYADKLLKLFVQDVGVLYGRTMLVYNVHCLTHSYCFFLFFVSAAEPRRGAPSK